MARRRRPRAESAPSRAAAVAPRSDFDRTFWLVLAALVPATLIAYQPAWHGALLWDDDGHVTKAALRSFAGLWRIWFEPGATQQYYPVVHSAFWLQAQLWPDNTTGHHLVNILLHAGSAGLLVAILRRLEVRGAILAGAIFALHPVHVESVAWITELKNTLSGVLYFGAALAYLHFDERRAPRAYLGAIGLFVLALLSKSVTATLPAGLLVVIWWKRGRLDWTRDVRPLLPFFGLGLAAAAMTVWVERTFIGAQGARFQYSFIERGLIAGRAVCFYLWTLVAPVNLAFSYPRWTVSGTIWWQYLYPAGVLAAIALLWRVRRWSRAPLAALLFFGVTLAPALGFVNVYPFMYSFVADHFQYLASAGVIALLSAAVIGAIERRAPSQLFLRHLATAAIVLPLALVTWRDSRAYVSKDVLYRTTIARNPDAWLAHNNLSALLLDREPAEIPEAVLHAREAVRLAPDQAATHFNLGLALEKSGDLGAAADAYRAAIANATPDEVKSTRIAAVREALARVEFAAGVTQFQSERPEQALEQLARAVEQAPGDADARFAYGVALERLNQLDRAVEQFRAAVKIQPRHAGARQHLGRTLHSLGRRGEAVEQYRAALAIDATSAETHNDLGVALAELGRFREAEPHFVEALRLKPDDAQARANLARARAMIKRGGGR